MTNTGHLKWERVYAGGNNASNRALSRLQVRAVIPSTISRIPCRPDFSPPSASILEERSRVESLVENREPSPKMALPTALQALVASCWQASIWYLSPTGFGTTVRSDEIPRGQ